MKGLVKYDLMQIAGGIKGAFVAVYLGLLVIVGFFTDMSLMYSCIFVFLSATFGIAAFQYEEHYHWDRYLTALPLTNKQIVLSRYGTVSVCIAVGTAAGFLIAAISFVTGNAGMPVKEWLIMMIVCVIGAVFYMELLIPIMYRFGSQNGRIVMIILFCAMIGVLGVLGETMENTDTVSVMIQMSWQYSVIIGVVAAAALLPVSVCIAAKIREKKEY